MMSTLKLLNRKGFSLISMLMAAGMMAGLALTLAELTKQQVSIRIKVEAALELVNLSRKISRMLYDGKSCKNTIGNNPMFTFANTSRSFPVDFIRDKDGNPVLQAGIKYGNNLIEINSMKLEVPKINNKVFEAKLLVVFKKTSKAIKGNAEVLREYPLSLEADSGGKLLGCNSSFDATARVVKSQLCKELGGSWNASGDICSRNALNGAVDVSCPKGQMVKGIDADGKLLCGSMLGCKVQGKCTASYEAVSTASFCNESEYLSRTQNYERKCVTDFYCPPEAERRYVPMLGTHPTSAAPHKEYDHNLDVTVLYNKYTDPATWAGTDSTCQNHKELGTYSTSYLFICCR